MPAMSSPSSIRRRAGSLSRIQLCSEPSTFVSRAGEEKATAVRSPATVRNNRSAAATRPARMGT
ncbi:hypothetical protein C1I98_24835 [Spongiactinospora gelatinilytica]|uniref:Uncharacterized protein n=1 Tax=Spongiactinospora gelatinilytica TaxID=2666298 RepID=A0A2W2FL60_9ACTN|nr:hypothetical protein C1I98_24835 [Spongiactinospora gelatinilytica]